MCGMDVEAAVCRIQVLFAHKYPAVGGDANEGCGFKGGVVGDSDRIHTGEGLPFHVLG